MMTGAVAGTAAGAVTGAATGSATAAPRVAAVFTTTVTTLIAATTMAAAVPTVHLIIAAVISSRMAQKVLARCSSGSRPTPPIRASIMEFNEFMLEPERHAAAGGVREFSWWCGFGLIGRRVKPPGWEPAIAGTVPLPAGRQEIPAQSLNPPS